MRDIRISIFAVVTILLAVGLIMIYSTSAVYAYENMGDSFLFLKRHLMFLAAGLAGAVAAMCFDYRKLRSHSRVIISLCVLALALVLVPSLSVQVGGARRWFRILSFSFQPSEMAKLGLIIYLADFLSRKGPYINVFLKVLLPLLAVAGAVMALILIQPDLGTVIVIGAFTFFMLFAAGIKWRYLALFLALSIPASYFLVWRVPYRWKRVMVFLNPWQDPQGSGFQIIQSFLAFGSGGALGVGLGMSRQKLFYLPEAHTDFIFSIIGEELGLLGTLSVIALFLILIWQGMRIVFRARDLFGRYLSLGIISMIAVEVLINIAVTMGALPTKGLPLPFISYGGSALLFHMVAIGFLLNVARDLPASHTAVPAKGGCT